MIFIFSTSAHRSAEDSSLRLFLLLILFVCKCQKHNANPDAQGVLRKLVSRKRVAATSWRVSEALLGKTTGQEDEPSFLPGTWVLHGTSFS